MPKNSHRPSLHIDILKPQNEAEPIGVRLTRFLLSTGRYIIIVVEIIVLGAFVSRFKLDSDLQTITENINAQIPVIESLKADEQIIRQTQLQLATIKDVKQNSLDYSFLLQRVAAQTPTGVTLTTISLEKNNGKVLLKIVGSARTNSDLTSFVAGLRTEKNFLEVNLASASLDKGVTVFNLEANLQTNSKTL